jgi:hypothetical protein
MKRIPTTVAHTILVTHTFAAARRCGNDAPPAISSSGPMKCFTSTSSLLTNAASDSHSFSRAVYRGARRCSTRSPDADPDDGPASATTTTPASAAASVGDPSDSPPPPTPAAAPPPPAAPPPAVTPSPPPPPDTASASAMSCDSSFGCSCRSDALARCSSECRRLPLSECMPKTSSADTSGRCEQQQSRRDTVTIHIRQTGQSTIA